MRSWLTWKKTLCPTRSPKLPRNTTRNARSKRIKWRNNSLSVHPVMNKTLKISTFTTKLISKSFPRKTNFSVQLFNETSLLYLWSKKSISSPLISRTTAQESSYNNSRIRQMHRIYQRIKVRKLNLVKRRTKLLNQKIS